MKIKYKVVTDFKNQQFEPWINWWSVQTIENEFTVSLEPAEIRNSMVMAVFAFYGKKLVGAAGLMPINGGIKYKGREVIEFRSNCVDENFRRNGIGTKFIELREDYADEKDFLQITITQVQTIIDITEKKTSGWVAMEDVPELAPLLTQLRKCDCHKKKDQPFIGSRCAVCPFYQRSILVRI